MLSFRIRNHHHRAIARGNSSYLRRKTRRSLFTLNTLLALWTLRTGSTWITLRTLDTRITLWSLGTSSPWISLWTLSTSGSRVSLRTLWTLRTGFTLWTLRTRSTMSKYKGLCCCPILANADDIACVGRHHRKSRNIARLVGIQGIRHTQQLLGGPYRVIAATSRVNTHI